MENGKGGVVGRKLGRRSGKLVCSSAGIPFTSRGGWLGGDGVDFNLLVFECMTRLAVIMVKL